MNIISDFRKRGMIHDVSHAEELEKLMLASPITFYCGFDPTADSLHVGSMLPLLIMRKLQRCGHKPIAILGSATGMIGDPSFKSEERKLLDEETLRHNTECIAKQISLFLDSSGSNPFTLLGNRDWFSGIDIITFLRDIGKHFSVNSMLAKDAVRERIENREQGISYTEFSYMLLQAYDFYHLYKNFGCRLQIGGSDQWGNITEGIDLIRRMTPPSSPQAFGLTFPLLMTSTGHKFGKTEKGSVWLDPTKTSPYRFYQFWVNTADEDVMKLTMLFTDFDNAELEELRTATAETPEKRMAQKRLAQFLTTIVHGADHTKKAEQAAQVLFGSSIFGLDANTLIEIFSEVPSSTIPMCSLELNIAAQDLAVSSKLASSKSQARKLIEGGGFYVNNERVVSPEQKINSSDLVDGKLLLLRSGKKQYHLLRAISES